MANYVYLLRNLFSGFWSSLWLKLENWSLPVWDLRKSLLRRTRCTGRWKREGEGSHSLCPEYTSTVVQAGCGCFDLAHASQRSIIQSGTFPLLKGTYCHFPHPQWQLLSCYSWLITIGRKWASIWLFPKGKQAEETVRKVHATSLTCGCHKLGAEVASVSMCVKTE